MSQLDKFTDDYIAKTATEQLNQERKNLIRASVAINEITRKMREELVRRGEEQKAVDDVAAMGEAKRAAIEKAIKNAKTTGAGKVS